MYKNLEIQNCIPFHVNGKLRTVVIDSHMYINDPILFTITYLTRQHLDTLGIIPKYI